MRNEIRPLNFTKQHNSLFLKKKKNVDFHHSWTFVWRSEKFTKLGDPKSLTATSYDRSGKKNPQIFQGTLFLLGLDSSPLSFCTTEKGKQQMREISAIKKVPFDLPWISQQRTTFLPFGFLLNTHSVTLRRWEISSGFHTHPQKRRCGLTTNFYAKIFCLQTCGWLNFCKWSSLFW